MAVVLQDLYGLVSHKEMALVAGKKGVEPPRTLVAYGGKRRYCIFFGRR